VFDFSIVIFVGCSSLLAVQLLCLDPRTSGIM